MATLAPGSSGVLDTSGLITMIISSAPNSMTHRRNCEQLEEHVKLVGNLLEKLKSTDLVTLPAVKEPLDGLEEVLKKALDLIESCEDKSCLYMLAIGWNAVYQFRQVHVEIDRILNIVPLISLVHEFRMQNLQEALVAIEQDQREYTLDKEEVETQGVILKPDRTKTDADVLEKSLSRAYPDLEFHEALLEEKQKLHVVLQRSPAVNDPTQRRVIEHLSEITENVVNVLLGKKVTKILFNEPTYVISGYVTNAKSSCAENGWKAEDQFVWQHDIFYCCSEPCLGLKTCLYPCGVFSRIANVVSKGKIPREQAISDLMTYSLLCGCCCYTSYLRKKLRELFNIEGGFCDDFLTHLMCCCCAMVQEWRELEFRGVEGCQGRKMIRPPYQYMKP